MLSAARSIAVVGSGPGGLYAVAELLKSNGGLTTPADFLTDVLCTLVDRLPTPGGLVRYGVSPFHQDIKQHGEMLASVVKDDRVMFTGNTTVDGAMLLALRSRHDAVILAAGAQDDRQMGIPGEDMAVTARQIVHWYNDHPATPPLPPLGKSAVVIGNGNVALDVARFMVSTPEELAIGGFSDAVVSGHRPVQIVNVVGRRGAEHAKFTTQTIRELSRLPSVRLEVEGPIALDAGNERPRRRLMALLAQHVDAPSRGVDRVIRLLFHRTPSAVLDDGVAFGSEILRGTVVSAVGFAIAPIAGLPAATENGLPHDGSGRVIGAEDGLSPVYVTGWMKRGATGKVFQCGDDAAETCSSVLYDLGLGDSASSRCRSVGHRCGGQGSGQRRRRGRS